LRLLSEETLTLWGRRIGEDVRGPLVLALRGPLGAGKSVLARAVCRGAGVEGAIPSPTYNLLFRYPAAHGLEVVHLDLYRLSGAEDLFELGWDELGAPNEVLLIEWPERAGAMLPADRWDIELRPVPGSQELRALEVTRIGSPAPLPDFPVSPDPRGGQP